MLAIIKVRKVRVIEKNYDPESSLVDFGGRCITGGGENQPFASFNLGLRSGLFEVVLGLLSIGDRIGVAGIDFDRPIKGGDRL